MATKTSEVEKYTPAVFLPHRNDAVSNMFLEHGFQVTFLQEDADFIVFTGGADINPVLYGESRNQHTSIDYRRDLCDMQAIKKLETHQRLIGICRGAQLLNVVLGNGTLYQHVNNHTRPHRAIDLEYTDSTETPKEFEVTSTHHQMMIPGLEGDVLLGARQADEFYCEGGSPVRRSKLTDMYEKNYELDAEAVFYNISHPVLCYQPHPEYVKMEDPLRQHFFNTIFDYMMHKDEVQACKRNIGG